MPSTRTTNSCLQPLRYVQNLRRRTLQLEPNCTSRCSEIDQGQAECLYLLWRLRKGCELLLLPSLYAASPDGLRQGPARRTVTDKSRIGTSHVYHHQEVMGPDTFVVRTVLLDKGKSFKPVAEIWGKAKMGWEPQITTTHDTLPPQ